MVRIVREVSAHLGFILMGILLKSDIKIASSLSYMFFSNGIQFSVDSSTGHRLHPNRVSDFYLGLLHQTSQEVEHIIVKVSGRFNSKMDVSDGHKNKLGLLAGMPLRVSAEKLCGRRQS